MRSDIVPGGTFPDCASSDHTGTVHSLSEIRGDDPLILTQHAAERAVGVHLMDAIRAAIERHWRASEDGDSEVEHAIYAADAILDYPQSGARFRGRSTIAAQRDGHPANRHFTVERISGSGDLWVSECIITYDGTPTHSISIMEFAGEHVQHETQYFADPFAAPAWRSTLAEPTPS
jgi:hypothetical protein